MKAPEKIYLIRNFPNSTSLNTTNDHYGKFLDGWYMSREKDADVEYTRTDAFINKACAFIRERLIFDDDAWYTDGELTLKDKVIEEFKKYMKGESL